MVTCIHLVSRILLYSAWFAWCLVFRDGTLAHWVTSLVPRPGYEANWVTHSVGVSLRIPGWAPQKLLLSTPFTLFVWLCAQVSPSVVHVGWYTNG